MTDSISRLCTKRDTQAQIKGLRAAGLTVVKDSGGAYSCDHTQAGSGTVTRLFTALPGRNGYLVRCVSNLFG